MVLVELPQTGYMVELLGSRRDAAERRMVDECVIRAKSTVGPYDEDLGAYPEIPGAILYQGKCERNTGRARLETIAQAGDHDAVITRTEIRIPWDAPLITRDAEVTITAALNQPTAVGQKFHVEGPGGKTWATAQRFNASVVVG